MGKPSEHALGSVKQFGGKLEDYIAIHEFIDSSRAALGDVRHRMLTHNTWFIEQILPKIFGGTIQNSDGTLVPVRSIAEQHVLEDYGMLFIPTPQDFLEAMELPKWMNNAEDGEVPPSRKKIKDDFYWRQFGDQLPNKAPVYSPTPSRKRGCGGAGRGVID